ncbi:hypothetical protein PTKIN_Ptkin11bG0169600 [Pterospermum kingtungense]
MDELPGDYLKCLYENILNISDEIEEEVMSKQGKSFSFSYTKEEVKRIALTYHVQARWLHERIMPSFDEYLENGIWSIGTMITMALVMMGMEEAEEDAYKWLIKFDAKILRAKSTLSRLYNDIQSNEEYGVSKKEAIDVFKERIKDGWKDLNEGVMERPMPVARQILMAAFNIARVSKVLYRDDDGYTKPEISLKNYITKVLIDPIPLQQ